MGRTEGLWGDSERSSPDPQGEAPGTAAPELARPRGPNAGQVVLRLELSEKTPLRPRPQPAVCRTAAFPKHSMNFKNLFIFVSQPLYNVFFNLFCNVLFLSIAAILVILPTVFIADLFCESCTLNVLFYVKIKSI